MKRIIKELLGNLEDAAELVFSTFWGKLLYWGFLCAMFGIMYISESEPEKMMAFVLFIVIGLGVPLLRFYFLTKRR